VGKSARVCEGAESEGEGDEERDKEEDGEREGVDWMLDSNKLFNAITSYRHIKCMEMLQTQKNA